MGNKFRIQDGLDVGGKFIIDTLTDTVDVNIPINFNEDVTFSGSTTSIDTSILLVEDKNIELGVVDTPSDATANAGGIILKGTTDKTIQWLDGNDSWNFNQDINLTTDILTYNINDAEVLSKTSLGATVVSSSLTSVGTLTSLSVSGQADLTEKWSTQIADFNAVVNNKYFVDTLTTGPVVVTVPTSGLQIGHTLEFSDVKSNFATDNVTIQGPAGLGFTYEGTTDTVLVLDVTDAHIKLVYTGDSLVGWKRIS